LIEFLPFILVVLDLDPNRTGEALVPCLTREASNTSGATHPYRCMPPLSNEEVSRAWRKLNGVEQ